MWTSLFLRMLNRETASPKHKPERIVESLELQEGQTIADIGSGGGYFTFQFAKKVGKAGKVYAVDVQQKYLDFVIREAQSQRLSNVVAVLATGDEMELPHAGLDLIFARNVFHHLTAPAQYFRSLKKFLKPGGKVVIIDHKRKGGLSFASLFKHCVSEQLILQEMEDAGYSLVASLDFLPEQTFAIFRGG
jgi:ubiquinone/menaquinone biosynthesis C-methylase UbiE